MTSIHDRHDSTSSKVDPHSITRIENVSSLPTLSVTQESSRLARYRNAFREYAAEFLGTMIFVIFGTGVNCQVNLSSSTSVTSSPRGDWTSVSLGWAAGLALGVWVSGDISGGHVNPAVTLTVATWRGFPWKKVPGYIAAQFLGAVVGAAIVYGNYIDAINLFEGGDNIRTLKTAGFFGTFALDYMTSASCFLSEFLGTAILMFVILSVTDKTHGPIPRGLVPMAIFVVLLGLAACLGMETSFGLNPARDFGPRVMTAMAGYGREVFTFKNQYWVWCPILAPILGAQFAAFLYDLFLFAGEGSIVQKFVPVYSKADFDGRNVSQEVV